MNVYAKQVPPEHQESPLFMGEWPENVYVFGNRHYNDHGGDYIEKIKDSMYEAANELNSLPLGSSYYESFIDIIDDLLPTPEHKKEYSRADRLKWRALLQDFDAGAISDDDATTAALELITGDEYAAATLRGCCQGDWNNIIYPAKYGREWLNDFEIEYFNLGAEWQINEGDPDGDDNYYIYTYSWTDDGQRAEIAAAAGVDPINVILYTFDGYIKTAKYKEVTA